MNALVDSAIRIPKSERRPKLDHQIIAQLTFPNPEFQKRIRFGRNTDGVPECIELVECDEDGALVIPRGAASILKRAAEECGELVRFEDRRLVCATVRYALRLALRDYQVVAADALAHHVQGCAVLPCGAGKSAIVLGAIERVGQPALLIVHTRDLVEQWVATVRSGFGIEPGVIAEGQVRLADVTIATIQSLAALNDMTLAAVAARFGCVVVDEAHHTGAASYRVILARLPAKYRFGVTATPDRADGLGEFLELNVGKIVYRLDAQALIDAGHLIVPRVEVVHTGARPHAEEDFAALVSELTGDPDRNRLLLSIMEREAAAGHAVLVLTGRVDHAHALACAALRAGVRAASLTGETAKKIRTQVLARFKAGGLDVLCATTIADEGLDVTRLSRLILATPAKAQGRIIQRLGRLMRPHEGKGQPVLFDLVDDHPIAARHHHDRLRAYRAVLGAEAVPST
jgi:superfamily II DNA or RNA helicase